MKAKNENKTEINKNPELYEVLKAIEKEKERLRKLDMDKQSESEVVESEPREDNEA